MFPAPEVPGTTNQPSPPAGVVVVAGDVVVGVVVEVAGMVVDELLWTR